MPDIISVQITAASRLEGNKIAKALVEKKLAACVNIVGVRSIYRWKGKVEKAGEVLLIAKTRANRFEALRKLVLSLHSYECPCIVAFPVTMGHSPFLAWIGNETSK